MPLYEYECDACGHRFEVIQKFSDPPVETCPSCGGKVRKLQSAPAFQFKGSGWDVTDYAKTGINAKTKAGKEGREEDKDAAGKADSAAATSATSASGEKAASSPTSSTGSGGST